MRIGRVIYFLRESETIFPFEKKGIHDDDLKRYISFEYCGKIFEMNEFNFYRYYLFTHEVGTYLGTNRNTIIH